MICETNSENNNCGRYQMGYYTKNKLREIEEI